MAQLNLQAFLDEIKNIHGVTDADVDAKIEATVKPLADKIAADDATLAAIQQTLTDLQSGSSDQATALQAIADQLANVQPAPQPSAPAPAHDTGVGDGSNPAA